MDLSQKQQLIRNAFFDANKRRPYRRDPGLIEAMTPGGGEWRCVAPNGAICRSIMWGSTEVAHVNPAGALMDVIEGQIAMAMRALPLMDATLRTIHVLADNPDNLPLIREMLAAAVAHIEEPAPRLRADPEDEEEEDNDEH